MQTRAGGPRSPDRRRTNFSVAARWRPCNRGRVGISSLPPFSLSLSNLSDSPLNININLDPDVVNSSNTWALSEFSTFTVGHAGQNLSV